MHGREGGDRKGGRGRQVKAVVFLSSRLLYLLLPKLLMIDGATAVTSDHWAKSQRKLSIKSPPPAQTVRAVLNLPGASLPS